MPVARATSTFATKSGGKPRLDPSLAGSSSATRGGTAKPRLKTGGAAVPPCYRVNACPGEACLRARPEGGIRFADKDMRQHWNLRRFPFIWDHQVIPYERETL
jgi:hypothetical protein